jgi:hypothetical protein
MNLRRKLSPNELIATGLASEIVIAVVSVVNYFLVFIYLIFLQPIAMMFFVSGIRSQKKKGQINVLGIIAVILVFCQIVVIIGLAIVIFVAYANNR